MGGDVAGATQDRRVSFAELHRVPDVVFDDYSEPVVVPRRAAWAHPRVPAVDAWDPESRNP